MNDWTGCGSLLDWNPVIPSHDTLARVFAALDSKQFQACFVRWMSTLCPSLAGEIVAMDGKFVLRAKHLMILLFILSEYALKLGYPCQEGRNAWVNANLVNAACSESIANTETLTRSPYCMFRIGFREQCIFAGFIHASM